MAEEDTPPATQMDQEALARAQRQPAIAAIGNTVVLALMGLGVTLDEVIQFSGDIVRNVLDRFEVHPAGTAARYQAMEAACKGAIEALSPEPAAPTAEDVALEG